MTKPREELRGNKLFSERIKRGYIKSSNTHGFDVVVDKDTLDYTDHVIADFGMFTGDKKHITYEEFEAREFMTN